MDEPRDLRDKVVGALGVVLVVALVIGGAAGAVAYGAVRASGITADGAAAPSSVAASVSPSASASATPSPSPSPVPTHSASPTPSPAHHAGAQHKKKHRHGRLTLSAHPRHVRPMGRIDLVGSYRGHGGAHLVVQRRIGGHWRRFPVSTTVRGGRFRTWVSSGRHGKNLFRVRDTRTGAVSPAVTVVVG